MNETAPQISVINICLDVILSVALIVLMVLGVEDGMLHEWLGIAVFILILIHLIFNRHFFIGFVKGSYTPLRLVATITDIIIFICFFILIANSIVISDYLFVGLVDESLFSWAQPAHYTWGYWIFLLVFFHAGLHISLKLVFGDQASPIWRKAFGWIVCAMLLIGGIVAFIDLDLAKYLLMQVRVSIPDFDALIALKFVEYILIALACSVCGIFVRLLCKR